MKRVVWFYILEPLFYQLFNSQKRKKNTVLLPILLRKTRQRRSITYDVLDELRRRSLSK